MMFIARTVPPLLGRGRRRDMMVPRRLHPARGEACLLMRMRPTPRPKVQMRKRMPLLPVCPMGWLSARLPQCHCRCVAYSIQPASSAHSPPPRRMVIPWRLAFWLCLMGVFDAFPSLPLKCRCWGVMHQRRREGRRRLRGRFPLGPRRGHPTHRLLPPSLSLANSSTAATQQVLLTRPTHPRRTVPRRRTKRGSHIHLTHRVPLRWPPSTASLRAGTQ